MAPGGSKYFVGMPTPASAGVIASIVHAFHVGSPLVDVGSISDWRWSVPWLLLAVSLGGLMTSTIRFYSFKDLPWGKKQPAFLIILTLLLLAVIWNFSEIALLVLASTYAIAGVTLHVVRLLRHRMVSRTAP